MTVGIHAKLINVVTNISAQYWHDGQGDGQLYIALCSASIVSHR
jgi:hypothetical protein